MPEMIEMIHTLRRMGASRLKGKDQPVIELVMREAPYWKYIQPPSILQYRRCLQARPGAGLYRQG